MAILVVAETRRGGLHPVSVEALVAAAGIGSPVHVVVPGDGADAAAACEQLAAYAVDGVTALVHSSLAEYTADAYVAALAAFIGSSGASWILCPHTYRSRDFVPALAARLDRGLVTDCIAVASGPEGVRFTRPVFRGKLNADVMLDPLGLVTCQVGAFRAEEARKGTTAAPITRVEAAVDPGAVRQRPEPATRETRESVDLSQAERIVAVGRGIKGPEQLELAKRLAEALGAELAASRPVCDAGWLPMDRQVGSSGQTVAPRLYVALGISGAIQHIVGMKGARTIVAVNKDPDAPIFEVADYGIVGDLFEIVPALVAALKG
jgi:electron transfer flavoprotein alpha subunit